MSWSKAYQRGKELSERETNYQNQTDMTKNIVQTNSGGIVQVLSGTLVCSRNSNNLKTIGDWIETEQPHWDVDLTIRAGTIFVDFPESVPTSKMESLLEHFAYQK